MLKTIAIAAMLVIPSAAMAQNGGNMMNPPGSNIENPSPGAETPTTRSRSKARQTRHRTSHMGKSSHSRTTGMGSSERNMRRNPARTPQTAPQPESR